MHAWTDTHTHLDFSEFDADRSLVLQRARTVGVHRMIVIGTRLERLSAAAAWVRTMPGLYATAGIHPGNVHEHGDDALDQLEALCRSTPFAAIGECGLDYHHLPARLESESDALYSARLESWKQRQKHFFRAQLELAARLGLGVVVHQRDSWDDTLAILRDFTGRVRAVFHCFGGSPEQLAQLTSLGHLISFTGIVTFKNAAQVQASAATAPAGSFMLETDCPYLAPVPHRGQRCEPAHIPDIAAKVAALRGISLEALSRQTEASVESFFRLD